MAKSVLDLIGNTPIVELNRLFPKSRSKIFAKLEYLNPGGSVKDRMAIYIINDAERRGLLKPGGTIVEGTSGNTGVGVSMVAAVRGYKAIMVIPDKMSDEKIAMMRAYGAKVIVTPSKVPAESPKSYYSVAARLTKKYRAFSPDQYNNPKNIEAHIRSTGPEIWQQMDKKIDVLIAGAGTGGTISGTAKFLKCKNPKIHVVGVDPVGSIFTSFFRTKKIGQAKPYVLEGIGEDKLGGAIDFSVIDEFIQVRDEDAFRMGRQAARTEGIFAGGSSGAALWAAQQISKRAKSNARIVVILPDSGNRYLSKMYNDSWMREHKYSLKP